MEMKDLDLDGFRAEAEAFFAEHALPRDREVDGWGAGSDSVEIIPSIRHDDVRTLSEARRWQATMFDAGLGWVKGPAEYGGRGLTQAHDDELRRAELRYDTPSRRHLSIGLGMVAPAILAFGTGAVRDRWLRPMHRGEAIGCQLFSEPDAGSDLASLQTRATPDGDGWVITGQKVWTSEAHHADVGLLLARSDPAAPKHAGITAFALDMHAPGVTVRPLRQMTGGASFNEVFFEDVRVPDEDRLGERHSGWAVARATLAGERSSIGRTAPGMYLVESGRVRHLLDMTGAAGRPDVRAMAAELESRHLILKWMTARDVSGPIVKLYATQSLQLMSRLVGAALGPSLVADTGAWGTYAWSELVLSVFGIQFGGGTDEIQRNLIGEQLLGLPRS